MNADGLRTLRAPRKDRRRAAAGLSDLALIARPDVQAPQDLSETLQGLTERYGVAFPALGGAPR